MCAMEGALVLQRTALCTLAIDASSFSQGLELANCLAMSPPGELLMSACSHRRLPAFASATAAESASASACKQIDIIIY